MAATSCAHASSQLRNDGCNRLYTHVFLGYTIIILYTHESSGTQMVAKYIKPYWLTTAVCPVYHVAQMVCYALHTSVPVCTHRWLS